MRDKILKIADKILAHMPWAFLCAFAIICLIYMNLTPRAVEAKKELTTESKGDTTSVARRIEALEDRLTALSAGVPYGTAIEEKTADERVQQKNAIQFPWLNYAIALLLLGGIVWLYRDLRKSQLNEQYIKDKDPDELRELFITHYAEISKLGTPRMVKRFSNRLRFQYNLLKISSLLTDAGSAEKYFLMMIQAERARAIFMVKTYKDFAAKFPLRNAGDEELLRKLYEFNRYIQV
jgi:hypothetical protein